MGSGLDNSIEIIIYIDLPVHSRNVFQRLRVLRKLGVYFSKPIKYFQHEISYKYTCTVTIF